MSEVCDKHKLFDVVRQNNAKCEEKKKKKKKKKSKPVRRLLGE